MAEKMLIDASHEEETRVVVVRGNRIEEFDFESQHKKQLRGNIYLAKVTRVEPSLQAAFVDYGGNRHGFLAFSEIHPDYYQIPLADRQALLQAEAEAARAEAERENADGDSPLAESASEAEETAEAAPKAKSRRGRGRRSKAAQEPSDAEAADNASAGSPAEAAGEPEAAADEAGAPAGGAEADAAPSEPAHDGGEEAEAEPNAEADRKPDEMLAEVEVDSISEEVDAGQLADDAEGHSEQERPRGRRRGRDEDDDGNGESSKVESVGAEDALEELPDRAGQRKPRKQYRIQEVIKRRQILLVQVVKEERGNKGAALTTYLSLAGRYSVLMPNTARGGGISRKITNIPDRKRLKEIARELEVPQGMGVILRTAGANRTKAEIKRDFEYLMRLWENVRSLTLSSTAPTLVYEEGSLIKRSIRDLYNKDIGEIVVSGEEGYREAKAFMKMLMPSHAKVVQPYRDLHPIFARSGIEAQLDRMLQPQVTLKSGGYIIINQTEALVAIDVNSGRSTKEHSIEDTALQTNLEAAEEVARQLRLRDLAGLIVIDFIDMEEKRNNRSVEKKLKDCLKNDRARIQVGRISHFGLLEMSRQRIRASVLESTTQVCEVCGGTGHVRSQSSVALHVIRGIEEYLLKNTTHNITVRTLPGIALYLLNQKRDTIVDLEKRFGLSIVVEADALVGSQHFAIERGEPVETPVRIDQIVHFDTLYEDEDDSEPEIEEAADESEEETVAEAEADDQGGRRRKRKRRRRGGRSGEGEAHEQRDGEAEGEQPSQEARGDEEEQSHDEDDEQHQRKRRRRGKRGGRRKRGENEHDEAQAVTPGADDAAVNAAEEAGPEQSEDAPAVAAEVGSEAPSEIAAEAVAPVTAPTVADEETPTADETAEAAKEPVEAADGAADVAGEAKEDQPAPSRRRASDSIASDPVVTSTGGEQNEAEKADRPKKVGWWQRRGFL
ncbi:MAG: Rne/Rng family ribonuclease [Pararhizobium sp.]